LIFTEQVAFPDGYTDREVRIRGTNEWLHHLELRPPGFRQLAIIFRIWEKLSEQKIRSE
jgi:hypothetical protein